MTGDEIPSGMVTCDNCNVFVDERSCDVRDVYNEETKKEITFFLCMGCTHEFEDDELLENMEIPND